MIFGRTTEEKNKKYDHHLWYAWYPVKLLDGRWAWLQYVTRCWIDVSTYNSAYKYNYWEYTV